MKEIVLFAKAINFISSTKPENIFVNKPFFYIGNKDLFNTYRTLLYFDIDILPADAFIKSAYLCLYCLTSCNKKCSETCITPYPIISSWKSTCVCWNNQPEINTQIKGISQNITSEGWYNFDITEITIHWIQKTILNKGIMLKSEEIAEEDVKRFISSNMCGSHAPILKIKYYNKDYCYLFGRKSTSFFEQYPTYDYFNYSNWVDTSSFTKSTFFITNLGQNPAVVLVQISPDKYSTVTENQQVVVPPKDTKIIEPMHFSFFSRIGFKSIKAGRPAFLKIWFQGHV